MLRSGRSGPLWVPLCSGRAGRRLWVCSVGRADRPGLLSSHSAIKATRVGPRCTSPPGKAKSTLSTPRYPTSHSIQKSRVGSFDAARRVGLGLRWTKNTNNYFLNYGSYCEQQQQQQQRQLEACSRFKFDRHQTAIGWIVSPRSPLVDGTCS